MSCKNTILAVELMIQLIKEFIMQVIVPIETQDLSKGKIIFLRIS